MYVFTPNNLWLPCPATEHIYWRAVVGDSWNWAVHNLDMKVTYNSAILPNAGLTAVLKKQQHILWETWIAGTSQDTQVKTHTANWTAANIYPKTLKLLQSSTNNNKMWLETDCGICPKIHASAQKRRKISEMACVLFTIPILCYFIYLPTTERKHLFRLQILCPLLKSEKFC